MQQVRAIVWTENACAFFSFFIFLSFFRPTELMWKIKIKIRKEKKTKLKQLFFSCSSTSFCVYVSSFLFIVCLLARLSILFFFSWPFGHYTIFRKEEKKIMKKWPRLHPMWRKTQVDNNCLIWNGMKKNKNIEIS